MDKTCPKCGSDRIYRSNPKSLEIKCESCCYKFEGKQVLKPILEGEIYKSKNPKGKYTIKVWLCPDNLKKYSFSINYGSGICRFSEFEEDSTLSGCYNSALEALEAGKVKALE